ncbi:peptide hydrolase [Favolaschia claudopus]|uniref:Peptide hydrolase n=1 Tax=Favolaschia claudopus TaxID=2862362 RepID=A0AAW0ED21_9AGAR
MISLAGTLLLVVPFAPSLFDSCLSSSYYGNFNDGQTVHSLFLPNIACLDSWSSQTLASSASIAEAKHDIHQLVWVQQEVVEPSLLAQTRSFQPEFDSFLQRLVTPKRVAREQDILVAPEPDSGYELLYRTSTAALLSVPESTARTIDTILPRFWKSYLVSSSPVDYIPVPDEALKHVKEVLSNLRFNPEIAAIVDSISVPQMINDIRFLTGEDGVSQIMSRHSFADGSLTAANWLKARFEDSGAKCELQSFLAGFSPNVICAYPSTANTTATTVVSAHYDSRGSFGSTRAPGGDDDGSGTIALLAIARAIARRGIKFSSNVQIAAFSGEEQGLLGSRAYARKMREINANITVVIQADMLGYRADGEPAQLGLPETIGTPEVTQLVANVSAIYSPELRVGYTAACCSDHQSFIEQGFPATQIFERAGPIADPMYHNSGDLSDREGYDFGQIKSIAKVQLATLLHSAGYEV